MPLTIAEPVHCELIIRKSRFIGCVQPVQNRAQAQEIVNNLWEVHPAATHICWALLAGGQSAAVDDGEPGGTAGRPMLEVLRHQDLEGVLATVVRYFGGVKLGAGGLVRAYTDTVAQALLNARKIELVAEVSVVCAVEYPLEGRVRYLLEQNGIHLKQVEHTQHVVFHFNMAQTQVAELHNQLMNLSQGKMLWRIVEDAKDLPSQ